jgi:HEPN domain-containing protein
MRIREAKALLDAGEWAGSYYLAGYSVECAIKACIARKTKKYEFPDKEFARECYSHNITNLIKLAHMDRDLQKRARAVPEFDANWTIAKDWNEEKRYEKLISQQLAHDLYRALTAYRFGVLPWLHKFW